MSRTTSSIRTAMAALGLVLAAGWSAGCAMKSPGFTGSNLGGPKPAPQPSPQVRAPLERVQPGTQTVSPVSTRRGTVVEVKEGDTLLGLSQHYKVPVSVLVSENGLRDLNIFPGMKLFVPKL